MKHERLCFTRALRVVWIGEGISIGIMELVMNWVDYWIGGVPAMSVRLPSSITYSLEVHDRCLRCS